MMADQQRQIMIDEQRKLMEKLQQLLDSIKPTQLA